jgi:NAD(P)-dependent dehydrogenase (short-subunit alcohol dehydrogenase family)
MSQPVVLITGAGRGLGRAIAERFARDGFTVVAAGRTAAPLRQLAEALRDAGGAAVPVVCDVTDRAQVHRAMAEAEQAAGPIDVLVNNAGAAESARFATMPDDLWERMLSVNLTGTYHCMRAIVPGMLGRGRGTVVNIASTAGKVGFAYTAAYCAAKHGVLGLTRAVALETGPRGVTVNAVCPGWIDTPMTDASVARIVETTGRSAEEARRTLAGMNPQRRLIRPDEVAEVVAFLASEEGRATNGEAIDV